MDLITQTVVGAAVGEFTLGKKAGNKALLWGAIGGIIPDLDIFITPFFNEVDGLFVHRGFTHSIVFAFIFAPVFGWLTHKIYRKNKRISYLNWTNLFFWSIFTHPLLDYLTTYGTGAFLPFSNYRVELSSVGIVDVFYTVPIILSLLIILFLRRSSVIRRHLIIGTLIISTFYLGATIVNKFHVNTVFEEAFANKNIEYDRYKTTALPLTNFLWMGIAGTQNGYYMGLYSNFDKSLPDDFIFIPRNQYKISHLTNDENLNRLLVFTKGYYHVGEDKNGIYIADLRFGKMGVEKNSDYIFKFYIKYINGNVIINQSTESRSIEQSAFSNYINRIKGI